MMGIKLDKDKDKNDEKNINNTELNSIDTQNNYQDSSMKSDNKIKLNEDILKHSKISMDKELISNDKENVNNKNDDINEPIPAFGGIGHNIFTEINRCFNEISIMIITIILLFCIQFSKQIHFAGECDEKDSSMKLFTFTQKGV